MTKKKFLKDLAKLAKDNNWSYVIAIDDGKYTTTNVSGTQLKVLMCGATIFKNVLEAVQKQNSECAE